MIFRRSEEGAVKCALRDLRLLLDTEVEYFILRSLVTASFRKAEARAFLRLLFSAGPRRAVQFSYGPRYACSDSIRMPSQSERRTK
jgi:hypothetical protein